MYKNADRILLRNTILPLIAIVFFIAAPIYIAKWQVDYSQKKYATALMVRSQTLPDKASTIRFLAYHGFDMTRIRRDNAPVPPLYLSHLPRELPHLRNIRIKKRLFLSALLPPILKVNQVIKHDRRKLKKMILTLTLGDNLSAPDYYWLTRKLQHYRIKVQDVTENTDRILSQLLDRMNVIPPAMALAQAIQESGWGSSRFAQKGNALYGQWTWSSSGCGIVPKQREAGKKHRIKCFGSIIEAVESYMMNINTHPTYAPLRQARRDFRDDQTIDVFSLVDTLTRYSEEGPAYVDKIRNIIRTNRLTDFNQAHLHDT